ncbi:MAG: hypothetical protein AAF456_21815 [Planctomycetota bacterium]
MPVQHGSYFESVPMYQQGTYVNPGAASYRQVRASREVRAFPRTPYSSPPFFRASSNLPASGWNARSTTIYGNAMSYQHSSFQPVNGMPYPSIPAGVSGCGCNR